MKHMEHHASKELPVVVVTITKETMMALRTDMCADLVGTAAAIISQQTVLSDMLGAP